MSGPPSVGVQVDPCQLGDSPEEGLYVSEAVYAALEGPDSLCEVVHEPAES